ncbi:MAG TPA: ABC transporter ATP-binding protein [Gaiellaceae bacterium]|nr:ABC transporter ATP-binding protein [Gaiellaceae bacterium]
MATTLEPQQQTAAVELIGITKSFPGVLANDRISLAVRRGEVHCLLGENGAGKSTLMSILSGMVRPDEGAIRIDGREVEISSPRRALELGIAMVYQHTTLVPTLTVLENLMLGTGDGVRLNARRSRERLAELAGALGVDIDPGATTGALSLGQQQQIEIIKALWRGSRVLILDEPTSMLTPQGVEELAKVLVRLKAQGLAVVFITHKLHETIAMGDRVSVLRGGRLVGAIEPEELRAAGSEELHERIVNLMFRGDADEAEEVAELQEQVEGRRTRRSLPADPQLELDRVSVAPQPGEIGLHDVSLEIRPGEIFGIAGVDGNGQRELAEVIAGQRPLAAGEILFGGLSIGRLKVAQREKLGLRYVTDDRLGEGTVSALSVGLNLVLKQIGHPPFWQRGRIRHGEIEATGRRLIDEYEIKAGGPGTRIGTLSGGNTQKVVLARELSFDPKLAVYNKPTYGLDIKTTQAVRERIRLQAEEGVTSVVISTDLEELLDLCDRIAVLSRGRLTGVVENGPAAAGQVAELMVGRIAA